MLPNKNKDYRKSVTNSISLNHKFDFAKNYTQKLDDDMIIINASPSKRGINMIQIQSKENQMNEISNYPATSSNSNNTTFNSKSKKRKYKNRRNIAKEFNTNKHTDPSINSDQLYVNTSSSKNVKVGVKVLFPNCHYHLQNSLLINL